MNGTERLRGYLPPYYDEVKEFDQLTFTEGTELDLLSGRTQDVLNQFYPESATWALDRYERDLQIVVDMGKPYDQRRSVIISKMRGSGKVSGSMIKNVAEAYDGGEVDVAVSPAEYKIIITFIDTLGIPLNLDDLKKAIDDIKPAHMSVVYEFRFLLIRDIHNVMTYNQLQLTPYSKFAFRQTGGA